MIIINARVSFCRKFNGFAVTIYYFNRYDIHQNYKYLFGKKWLIFDSLDLVNRGSMFYID